jgi:transposase-like protein
LEVEEILGEYAKSGLTQRVFAREIGVGVSTLQYWLRRNGQREPGKHRRETRGAETLSEVSLLEVDLGSIARGGSAIAEGYEIEWANGTRLRVPRGFGKEELRALLGTMKEEA